MLCFHCNDRQATIPASTIPQERGADGLHGNRFPEVVSVCEICAEKHAEHRDYKPKDKPLYTMIGMRSPLGQLDRQRKMDEAVEFRSCEERALSLSLRDDGVAQEDLMNEGFSRAIVDRVLESIVAQGFCTKIRGTDKFLYRGP